MLQNRPSRRLSAGLILLFFGVGAAVANPKINEVLTAYSTAGAPISINILGTTLCTGSPCVAPTVTLGGKSVSISAYSPTSITAKLPQPLALGDYTLKVVNASGSTTFELTLANLATQGPAGPGAMLVKDSKGTVVGTYLNSVDPYYSGIHNLEHVVIRTSSLLFAALFTPSQLGGNSNIVYFVSSDCTGTGYIGLDTDQQTALSVLTPALPYAKSVGTTAYIGAGGATATIANMNFSSVLQIVNSVSVSCVAVSNTIAYVVPVDGTFDLSTLNLVPPFSVH